MAKLFKRSKNAPISGVCGGIANYLNIDPLVSRLLYTFATVLTGFFPFVLFYIIMWIFVPKEENV